MPAFALSAILLPSATTALVLKEQTDDWPSWIGGYERRRADAAL